MMYLFSHDHLNYVGYGTPSAIDCRPIPIPLWLIFQTLFSHSHDTAYTQTIPSDHYDTELMLSVCQIGPYVF